MQSSESGVLTSGGDAPGMNAAIRAVVRSAIYRGIDCVGIRRGFNGLINGDFVRLDENSVNHYKTAAAQCSIRQEAKSSAP